MNTAKWVAQHLIAAATVFAPIGMQSASAQTTDAVAEHLIAVAAYERRDYAAAFKGFRLASEQGYAYAQFNLGIMYYQGDGVPEDASEAMRWFRRAAEQGLSDAQFNLGSVTTEC